MRPIDADALKERLFGYYECVNPNTAKETYRGETLMAYEVADMINDCVDDAPTISPDSLVKRGRCELCEDYDNIANMVCYIPLESGEAKDILVKFCPVCGGALMED